MDTVKELRTSRLKSHNSTLSVSPAVCRTQYVTATNSRHPTDRHTAAAVVAQTTTKQHHLH